MIAIITNIEYAKRWAPDLTNFVVKGYVEGGSYCFYVKSKHRKLLWLSPAKFKEIHFKWGRIFLK